MSGEGIELHTAILTAREKRSCGHGTGIEDDDEGRERDGAKLRERFRFWALSVVINLLSPVRSHCSRAGPRLDFGSQSKFQQNMIV